MDTDLDEALCQNCGRCCRLKASEGAFFRLTGKDCRFLSRKEDGTTECLVYPHRLSLRLGDGNVCTSIKMALENGDLPPDCPYALRHPGYSTKVIDWMV